MTHLTDEELQSWADGEAPDASHATSWGSHVDSCAVCAGRVASLRSLSRGMNLWADDLGLVDDLADRVMRAANAAKPAAPARVIPLKTRARWLWGAAPLALVAAAALVFSIGRPVHPGHVAVDGGHPLGLLASQQGEPVMLEPDLAMEVDQGSQVLSVGSGENHAIYSVMELQMKASGTPVAVVWIDDSADEHSGGVQ